MSENSITNRDAWEHSSQVPQILKVEKVFCALYFYMLQFFVN